MSGLPPNGLEHLWLNDGGDTLLSLLCVNDAGRKLPSVGDPAIRTCEGVIDETPEHGRLSSNRRIGPISEPPRA